MLSGLFIVNLPFMSTMLNKSLLHQKIISILSNNSLGYKFIKSNYRYYYFSREADYKGATDLMTITVYFEKGEVSCFLQSHAYKAKTANFYFPSGFLYRYTFLLNSKSDANLGSVSYGYYFQKNVDSLTSALQCILFDLDVKGKEFVDECDRRYSHPKFTKGMEFIKNLTVDKEEIRKSFPNHHAGAYWELNNETQTQLKLLFDAIDEVDKTDHYRGYPGRLLNNSYFAYEFLNRYVYETEKKR